MEKMLDVNVIQDTQECLGILSFGRHRRVTVN